MMLRYFAYGSNLHPIRLTKRIPSAKLVAVVELGNHYLGFHKKSHDGSSKCNLLYTGSEADSVHGAVYELDPRHKCVLDKYEGKGFGYIDRQIRFQHHGRDYTCFTYFAQQSHVVANLKPYHWYKKLVVLGARYLRFPPAYISAIEAVGSVEDLDGARRKEREVLIAKIIDYR